MLARPLSATSDVSRAVPAVAASITSESAAVSTRDAQRHVQDPCSSRCRRSSGWPEPPEGPLVVWSFMTQIIVLDGAVITIQRVRQHLPVPGGPSATMHSLACKKSNCPRCSITVFFTLRWKVKSNSSSVLRAGNRA